MESHVMHPLPTPLVVRRATRLGLVLAILGPLSLSASAQDLSGDKGRFTMSPVENSLVRLDAQTGAITHCKPTE